MAPSETIPVSAHQNTSLKDGSTLSYGVQLLEESWRLSDELFEVDIGREKALCVPISLRQPFIFYLGHLPSFAANTLGVPSGHAGFDHLFSRGIDPDVDDPTQCHAHPDVPSHWPAWDAVTAYRDAVRAACRAAAPTLSARRLGLVAEHELMHIETLQYMLAQAERPAATVPDQTEEEQEDVVEEEEEEEEWCEVEEGETTTGCAENAHPFAWDNELDETLLHVPAFRIQTYAVSIAYYMHFVKDGGYDSDKWWHDSQSDDRAWRSSRPGHPLTWERDPTHEFRILTTRGRLPWRRAMSLPASVCLAEARAYARWRSARSGVTLRVPTEAQWVRAAYGGVDGGHVAPTGMQQPSKDPVGVRDMTCNTKAKCGAVGMVGNGWELTTTVFDKFPSFVPMREYPEYSADFFDAKHFVLKGASWATHKALIRKSFRNFYQARYPYVFSKFRLVHDRQHV